MRRARQTYRLYHKADDEPCTRARAKLDALGVPYVGVVVPDAPEQRAELLELTGQRRVPVLVDGEILVIGEREVVAYVERTRSLGWLPA